jgi:Family of unknown function (DUF6289)
MMKPVVKLILVALVAAVPVLLTPPRCEALQVITERYYSDDTYSVLVGSCTENHCTGAYSCWGEVTDYVKFFFSRCTITP